jgi:hypothetical protein
MASLFLAILYKKAAKMNLNMSKGLGEEQTATSSGLTTPVDAGPLNV